MPPAPQPDPASVTNALQVRVFGTKALTAKIRKIQGFATSPRMRALFEDAGEAYVLLARRDAPKATRMLSRSINHRTEGFGTPRITLKVGFDERSSRWARFVEFGSGPSVRIPRLKRWMHWFSNGEGGKTIQEAHGLQGQGGYTSNFRKRVRHPGTRPQPFFLKHLPDIQKRLLQGLKQVLDEEIKSAGDGPRGQ